MQDDVRRKLIMTIYSVVWRKHKGRGKNSTIQQMVVKMAWSANIITDYVHIVLKHVTTIL